MKKNTKKILIFVVALVAVIAVVACIMLFLDRKDDGNTDVSPTPSASPSETIPPSPSETPVSPSEEPSPSDVVTEETADGTKYTITATDSEISYSVIVDSSVFEYKREDGRDVFADKSASDGSVFLEIYRTEGGKAETIAPGFLDQYIKYTEFDYSGVNYLSDEVFGETVMANDGKTQVEAWLIDADGGILAVVIRYELENASTQKTKLYDVLATIGLN